MNSVYLIKSFLAFANTGFKSKLEEKSENNEKNNYGKPVIELMAEFANQLDINKKYTLENLRNLFSDYVFEVSKIKILVSTRNAHFTTSIINDKNRVHYNVKDPRDKRKNIFFYPNENDKRTIMVIGESYPPKTKIYFRVSKFHEIDFIMTEEL